MSRLAVFLVPMLALLSACATPDRMQAAPAAPTTAASPAAASGRTYVASSALHLAEVLPPPPAAGSPQERAELDAMLAIQQARTPAQVERAQADVERAVWRFADALGNPPAFNAAHLPLAAAFFERLSQEIDDDSGAPKDVFKRPRPFMTEPRLSPVVSKPKSYSYPSGHSTWAHAMAIVLADMLPEYQARIFARGEEYSHNRVVGGVHYPSDIEGGKLCGAVIANALFASPRFRTDEAAAAAELRQALGLPSLAQAPH